MIRLTFYDLLKEELRRGGLWQWGKDRPYREVIAKPEILFAHERAWKRLNDAAAHVEGAPAGPERGCPT